MDTRRTAANVWTTSLTAMFRMKNEWRRTWAVTEQIWSLLKWQNSIHVNRDGLEGHHADSELLGSGSGYRDPHPQRLRQQVTETQQMGPCRVYMGTKERFFPALCLIIHTLKNSCSYVPRMVVQFKHLRDLYCKFKPSELITSCTSFVWDIVLLCEETRN